MGILSQKGRILLYADHQSMVCCYLSIRWTSRKCIVGLITRFLPSVGSQSHLMTADKTPIFHWLLPE